ncbi:chemotaxis protein CheW [Sinimarinibacterium sp. CAU 1509]|nr:chemotaxis protein CheW [Sinimarinibacterium sp. CAU 1509]
MSGQIRAMRGDPFGQLLALEEQLQASRVDSVAGTSQNWIGLGFRIGERWFVAPREDVREVIPQPPSTHIPNAASWLRGLANVRGELLAIVDLAGLLGLTPSETHRAQRVLVLNSRRIPAGLLVDEVAGYRQFTVGEQRNELVRAAQPFTPYLLGAFVHEGQPWLAMSLHKVALGDAFRTAAL